MRFREMQRRAWALLDDPTSSKEAKAVSIFMMLVIALSVLGFTLESVPDGCRTVNKYVEPPPMEDGQNVTTLSDAPKEVCPKPEPHRSPYTEIEYVCIIIFTVEYILRLLSCSAGPGVCRFLAQVMNLIDLISILPFYIQKIAGSSGLEGLAVLRVLRLARVLRIFKLSRNFQGLILLMQTFRKSAGALLMLTFFVAMSLVVFATLIFYCESGEWDEYRQQYVRSDGQQTPFESIPASMWWCLVTMTTVGYGDVTPITLSGRVVAIVTMFCGLVVLSLPITIIGANFDELYREMRKKEHDARAARKLAGTLRPRKTTRRGSKASESEADVPPSRQSSSSDVDTHATQHGGCTGDAAEALRVIQGLINQSHQKLFQQVELLISQQESELRQEIKRVLANFSACAHLVETPLDKPAAKPHHLAATSENPAEPVT
mmetsp:Transcript_14021/g.29594  ORF Transcript_14021/g.29594 Transcript_14021/m.29594 type:complete len:432 (+) Transcript_14021:378-1673(+)